MSLFKQVQDFVEADPLHEVIIHVYFTRKDVEQSTNRIISHEVKHIDAKSVGTERRKRKDTRLKRQARRP